MISAAEGTVKLAAGTDKYVFMLENDGCTSAVT
jgi:hypothetical protein